MSGVGGHRGEQQSGCQHRQSEHRHGHSLPGRAFVESLAEETGGKREERDGEQEEQVQSEEDAVDVVEVVGETGVRDPGGADRQEADEVHEIGRPTPQELLQRRTGRPERKVEHEQRDGDGQHAVTERLHPVLAQSGVCRHDLLLVSHGFPPGRGDRTRPRARVAVACRESATRITLRRTTLSRRQGELRREGGRSPV